MIFISQDKRLAYCFTLISNKLHIYSIRFFPFNRDDFLFFLKRKTEFGGDFQESDRLDCRQDKRETTVRFQHFLHGDEQVIVTQSICVTCQAFL